MKQPVILNTPIGIANKFPPAPIPLRPFDVYVTDVFEDEVSVAVSEMSQILSSPSTDSEVPIAKLGAPMRGFKRGSKVWAETYFDRDLQPVYSILTVGTGWAVTNNSVNLYPDCVDIIGTSELASRIAAITQHYVSMGGIKQAALDETAAQLANGYISQAVAGALTASIITKYDGIMNSMRTYLSDLPNFFSGSQSSGSGARKQIALFTPIAYGTTSKITMEGTKTVSPYRAVAPFALPTVTFSEPFRILPIVSTDLMLTSIFHKELWPAKITMPYHAGRYGFITKEGSVEP